MKKLYTKIVSSSWFKVYYADELQRIWEQGHKAGYSEGFGKGYNEAKDKFSKIGYDDALNDMKNFIYNKEDIET